MPPNDYRMRLSTELTSEQSHLISQVLPHGWQKPLIQALLNGVLELYQRGGIEAIGAIISRHLDLTTIVTVGFERTKKLQIIELEKKLREFKGDSSGHD